MDDVLYLVTEIQEQDANGVFHPAVTKRIVFCEVESVTRSEYYNAGRSGLNPEYNMTVFQGDYNGETVAEYNGLAYGIYRTYKVPGTDYMELYLERKGGTNGRLGNETSEGS